MQYPKQLEIKPLIAPPHATVRVPGSKSITNRALVLAALTATDIVLQGALQSEDTEVMVESLRRLGFDVASDWGRCEIRVCRPPGDRIIPAETAELFVANSGTSMRFLTAMVALGHGRYRLDGVPRMRERPIEDLLSALKQLGVAAVSEKDNGCPPVVVDASGLSGGNVCVRADTSSQFLSGLLMAAPFAKSELLIEFPGTVVSYPYVQMTRTMLHHFGLESIHEDFHLFRVPAPQRGSPLARYSIEPDASAASYFYAAAAISGGSVTVAGLPPNSLQGDLAFLRLLRWMGCRVEEENDSITVHGGPLRGIPAEMGDISDTVMTLAAVACFAEGPTTIRNVGHIRHKETDRLTALATELRRIGAGVEEWADGLTITPRPLHGAVVETYNDHRMAMSLALVGLKVPGIVIDNPGCVAKTYPRFFEDLERLR